MRDALPSPPTCSNTHNWYHGTQREVVCLLTQQIGSFNTKTEWDNHSNRNKLAPYVDINLLQLNLICRHPAPIEHFRHLTEQASHAFSRVWRPGHFYSRYSVHIRFTWQANWPVVFCSVRLTTGCPCSGQGGTSPFGKSDR